MVADTVSEYQSAAVYCRTEEDAAVVTILEDVFGLRFSFYYCSNLEWVDADRACTVFFHTSDGRNLLLKSDPMPHSMHVVEGENEACCMSTLVRCLKTGTNQLTSWDLAEGVECENVQVPSFSSAAELKMKLELRGDLT